jgi:hypothetical protein
VSGLSSGVKGKTSLSNTTDEVRGQHFLATIEEVLPKHEAGEDVGTKFFIWSDVCAIDPPDPMSTYRFGVGQSIANFLEEHKLGDVTQTKVFRNGTYGPKGNRIKVFILVADQTAIRKYLTDNAEKMPK